MGIFEQASRQKLRFQTRQGYITTEELWDLSLTSLDDLAKAVNKKVKESTEESFIGTPSKENKQLVLALDVLKHVISVKLAEADAAKNRKSKQQQLAALKELREQKAAQELSNKSGTELDSMIAALEAEMTA